MANDLQFKIVIDTSTGVASIKSVDEALQKVSKDTKSTAQGIQDSLSKAFMPFSTLKEVAGTIGSTFKNLFSGFATYESSIMRIANVSGEFYNNIENIKGSLKGLIAKVPVQSMDELTDAYRRAAGMGYSVSDSFKLTELSAKAALGTFGNTADSMNALVSVMGAWNMSAKDSNSTMDILVTLANRTGQSMSDIGNAFGLLAPMASAAGISFTDLSSTISTMTKTGLPMEKVVQRLAMVLPKLSQVISKTLGEGTLQTKGLTESLYALAQSSSGFDELSKQTGRFGVLLVESIAKNYALAKNEATAFNSSIGATEETFKRQSGTLQNQLTKLSENIKQIKNSAISALAPIFKALTEAVVGFITKIKEAPKWIQQLISVFAVLLPTMVALKVTGLGGIITNLGLMSVKIVGTVIPSFATWQASLNATAVTTKILNGALSIGLIGAITSLIYFMPDIIKFFETLGGDSKVRFNNLINESNKASDALKEFDSNIKPLAARFDELNSKTNKTAEEQNELKKITNQLVAKYPELAVGINQTTGEYILNNNAMSMSNQMRQQLIQNINREIESLGRAYLAYRYMIPAEKEAVQAIGGVMGFFKNLVGISSTDKITESQKRMDQAFKTSIEIYVKSLDDVDLTTQGVKTIIDNFTKTSHISLSQLNDDHIKYAKSLLASRKAELDNLKSLNSEGVFGGNAETKATKETAKKEFDEILKIELDFWKTRYDLREISVARFTVETNKLYDKLINNDKYKELLDKQNKGLASTDQIQELLKYEKLRSDIITVQNKELDESVKIEGDAEKEREAIRKKDQADFKEYVDNVEATQDRYIQMMDDKKEEEKKILEEKVKYYLTYFTNSLSAIGNAFNQGLNFANLGKGLKEAFKGILIELLNMVEAEYIIAKTKSVIETIITGGWSAIRDIPLLLAGGVALEAAKAYVSSFAIGGLITKPTLALMGESGAELVAPKKDFLTVARELLRGDLGTGTVQSGSGQRVYIQLNGKFETAGRTMIATIDQENYYQAKRRL